SLFQTQASFWKARGLAPLEAWVPASAYDPVPYLSDTPIPNSASRTARLAMMRGEMRSVAINLANSRQTTVTIQAHVQDLPQGIGSDAVRLQAVNWIDTQSGTPVATPLTPL